MASYQVGETCYPALDLALSAYASRFVPTVVAIGTNCNGYPVASVSGSTIAISWLRVSGTCASPATVNIGQPVQACSLYGIEDAAVMSWQVAAVWLVVFGVAVVLKRALQ